MIWLCTCGHAEGDHIELESVSRWPCLVRRCPCANYTEEDPPRPAPPFDDFVPSDRFRGGVG